MSTDTANPANDAPKSVNGLPEYRPFQAGVGKLEVPKKEGYVRYWFRGEPGRIQRALQAGWTFVDQNDVKLNNFDLGGDAKASGNTDMGSRVSVISGADLDGAGNPNRLYLMECTDELYYRGRANLDATNDGIATALRGGKVGEGQAGNPGETAADVANKYGKVTANLFTPKNRRT